MKGQERPQATKANRYRPKPVWTRPADSPRKPYPVGRLPKAKRGPTQSEGSFTQHEARTNPRRRVVHPTRSTDQPKAKGRLPKAKRGPTQGEGSFTQSEGSFTQSEASFTLGPAF